MLNLGFEVQVREGSLGVEKVLWGFCRAPLEKESPFHCYQDVGHVPCRALLCSCSSAAPHYGKRALLCQTFAGEKIFYLEERCPFSQMTKENEH